MEIKGDFLGFSFMGKRSEDLGIVRVIDGDRYDEDLQPDINDITADVPGVDGSYYFGTTYGKKTISISIAFDSLTEKQFRNVRKVFGQKNQGELIFDERPYKKYMAKIDNPIELSYICFDGPVKEEVNFNGINGSTTVWRPTGKKQRIYKGEGKISFTTYFPFAKSVFKILNTDELINNDWAESSGILTSEEYATVDKYDSDSKSIIIYNAGDVATGFRLYIPMSAASQKITLTYQPAASSLEAPAQLVINPITQKDDDMGDIVDTNNGLIVGVQPTDSIIDQKGNGVYKTSGNLYNEYVDSGYFFKFLPNEKFDNATLYIDGEVDNYYIFYDYLYF